MSDKRPTPETDSWCGWGVGGLEVVPASFARNLERERDELLEALEKIESCDGCFAGAWMRVTARMAIKKVKGSK